MIRTQVQLEEQQYERLKALAASRAKSISQLVREGVDLVLAVQQREETWNRLLHAAGSCHDRSGASDAAARHDAYLADVYSDD